MNSHVIQPRLAAPQTSYPVARQVRPRMTGGMPQIVSSSATPGVGAAEGAAEGAVVFGLLGALIGHFAGHLGAGAAIGAGVGALATGYLGYTQAQNNANS